jgi:3,4-dihydroxy-9,10-secoandrosta-1,3,5(10)-triene-9,17-dione 4,5-dioxygenase
MSTVTALGYLRLTAPDLAAWRSYATSVLGLQVGEAASAAIGDGALYLKQDDRSYRVAIDQGDEQTTTFGWEVANRAALDDVAARLDASGVSVKEASSEHAQSRLAFGMILCDDPAGNRCEIFYGAGSDREEFVSPTNAQFTTGDMGLGHAFMMVPDGKAFLDFYSLLGFRVSDYISFGPGMFATFMHCNPRHHTLAFVEVPNLSALQHFMVEVDSLDTVGRSYDRCVKGEAPIVMALGRHTNDRMFSYYSSSPSGIAVEFGTEGIRVDDETWTVQNFDAASYWGHTPPVPLEMPS